MLMKADLHNHTIHSDGLYTIEEVAKRGKTRGLSMIAITDHDNLDSFDAYLKVKDQLDITVLIGVELSTWYHKVNIHMLGYFYNNSGSGEELLNYLKEMREKRIIRAKKMIALLKEVYDIDVDYDEVKKLARDVVGRPHLARYISKKYNIPVKEVFDKYLYQESKVYIPATTTSTEEAVELLHRNNAIAVWAHPVLNKGKVNEEDIIKLNIDGIEGFYPENTEEDTKHYRKLAEKYNLLFTGGSDFHDDTTHHDIGTCYIEGEDLDRFVKKLKLK